MRVIVTADPATGRATAIQRLSLSAHDVEALADRRGARAMSTPPDLFDQPFEEDPSESPTPRRRRPRPDPAAPHLSQSAS